MYILYNEVSQLAVEITYLTDRLGVKEAWRPTLL